MKEYKHELTKLYAEFSLGIFLGDTGKVPKVALPFRKIVEPILEKLDGDTEGLRYIAEKCVEMVNAAKRDGIIK